MIAQDGEQFIRPVFRSLGRTVQRRAQRIGVARRPLCKTQNLRIRKKPLQRTPFPLSRVFAPLSQSLRALFLPFRQRTGQRTLSRRLDFSGA